MADRVVACILFLFVLQCNLLKTYAENLPSVYNQTYNESLLNLTNNNNTHDLIKSNDLEICNIKTCIFKCCPPDKYVLSKKGVKTCVEYKKNFTFDFSTFSVHDKDKTRILTTVGNAEYIHLVPDKFANETFKINSFNGGGFRNYKTYLAEDGVFYLESHNTYEKWIRFEKEHFCIDYQVSTKGRLPTTRIWIEWYTKASTKTIFLPITLVVSCVFLLIVLVVYGLLPELRNLCGLILIAYVASLFWAFLLLAVIQSGQYLTETCVRLTLSIYFFFMASFCWMNVMSYDIWWTFRGYAKARPIHRRGEHFKFAMYCLYAWGLPLGMTVFTGIMNTDIFQDKPWVIQPNIGKKGCFMDGGEKLLYLYSPMLILLLSNWMFYLMTAFNVWRLSRGTGVLDSAAAGTPAAHRTHRQRFMVYLKLSVVMGLNWVLEVISYVYPGLRLWFFTDAYNMLMGLFIFLIFVCKIKIYKKLKKRFQGSKTQWSPSTKSYASSSSDSTSTLDASLPVVCSNPKGPAYPKP